MTVFDLIPEILSPVNSERISGLSVTDPFAIMAFVLSILIFPILFFLLIYTQRRSADGVWQSVLHRPRPSGLRHRMTLLPSPAPTRTVTVAKTPKIKKTVAFEVDEADVGMAPLLLCNPDSSDPFDEIYDRYQLERPPAPEPVIEAPEPEPREEDFEDVYDRAFEEYRQARRTDTAIQS